MSSIELYQRWIQSAEQSAQPFSDNEWRALGVSRRVALQELVAPLEHKVQEAVAGIHDHLVQIDNTFVTLLRARQSCLELQSHYSTLFYELRVPDHLTTPTSQAFLREYVQLLNRNTSPRATIADLISALGALKSDLEQHVERERMERALAAEQARQQLLALIGNTHPLLTLESCIDTRRASAAALCSELREGLEMLIAAFDESRVGDAPEQRLQECLIRVQNAFYSIRRAIKGSESEADGVSSERLVLADLNEVVKRLYPSLPRPAFDHPNAQVSRLPNLSSDERQAYLVVMRHIDVSVTNQAEYEEFRQTAIQERDWLLKDLISRLGVGGANDLIREQLKQLNQEERALGESIASLIAEANARLQEDRSRIQIEAEVEQDIAHYLASQRFDPQDLRQLIDSFTADSDLQLCFAKVLRGDVFKKGGSLNDLRQYLVALSEVLRDARSLSPILIESILLAPPDQLATRAGLDTLGTELKALGDAPGNLRARELEALVGIIAHILEANFPYGQHVSDQYRVAARVVVFGLAPQIKDRELDRPVRDCVSMANLVSRSTGVQLSFAIVNDTIQTHLLPHLVVCKNQSESNPVKRRYQLLRSPDERLASVVAHLEYIARRPVSAKKKSASSQATTSKQALTSSVKTKVTNPALKRPPVDPLGKERTELVAKQNLLTRQLGFLEEKSRQLAERTCALASVSNLAQPLQLAVDRLGVLSTRLSSSVHNNLSYLEQGSYMGKFDRYCFSRLREKVGFSRIMPPARVAKALSKKTSLSEIRKLVFACALERYPDMPTIFNEIQCARAELLAVEKELLSSSFWISRKATAKLATAIATYLGTNSALTSSTAHPDCLAILCRGFKWIENLESRVELQAALEECQQTIQQQLVDVAAAIERVSGQLAKSQDKDREQGGDCDKT